MDEHITFFKQPKDKRQAKNRIGKAGAKWLETRNEWIQQNPPVNGYWTCYLQITPLCPRVLDIDQVTLDHEVPKGRNKKLQFDLNNLKPACAYCNGAKGSNTLQELKRMEKIRWQGLRRAA